MKISVQSGDIDVHFGFEKGYRMIREAGFDGIDWNIDHAISGGKIDRAEPDFSECIFIKPLDEVLAYYEPELKAIREAGLEIFQAHSPFPAYSEKWTSDHLDEMIAIYTRCIELCDAVGCPKLVVHGISCPPGSAKTDADRVYLLNRRLYMGLIPALKKTNVTVCLENLFMNIGGAFTEAHCSDPHLAMQLIDGLNIEAGKIAFGFCLDTGHLNLLRKNQELFFSVLGQRITAFHIHDNTQTGDSHLAPFTGVFDWALFCRMVAKIGYEGNLSFETFNQTRKTHAFEIGDEDELTREELRHIAAIGRVFAKRIENGKE